MICNHCQKSMARASGMVRSVFIDGFEVLVRVRRANPGEVSLCESCVDQLIKATPDVFELNRVERDTHLNDELTRPPLSRI